VTGHAPGLRSAVGSRTLEVFARTPRLNAWLYSKLAPHVRGDVLEVGSGVGNLSRLILADAARAVLSDVDPHYLAVLRRELASDDRVVVASYDLDQPPPAVIAARRFDAVVAVNVVEHIEDDALLVQRLAGLLKPGGRLLVYVPAGPYAYGTLDRALGHFRRYTRASLEAVLARAGLVPETTRYFNLLGVLGWLVSGRVLRREQLPAWQVALFERVVPLARFEEALPLPLGLGLYAHARKPPAPPSPEP